MRELDPHRRAAALVDRAVALLRAGLPDDVLAFVAASLEDAAGWEREVREADQEKEEKDERYHRVERSYGAFTRSLRVPASVEAGKVTATFKDGLLTVTMPKAPGAKGTTIPVKAG